MAISVFKHPGLPRQSLASRRSFLAMTSMEIAKFAKLRTMKKALSLFLCLCLLWTSGNLADAALYVPELTAHPSFLPQFELTPPPALGRVVDYFNAPSPPPSPAEGGRGSKGEGTYESVAQYGMLKRST